MQNNIYNFALKSGEINRNVLCEMCDLMPEDMRQRFIEAILCIVNVHEVVASIPTESRIRDGIVRTMTGYNYLMDRLDYSYKEDVTRYFKDEDKAARYIETGDYFYDDSNYEQKDAYPYAGTHTFERHSDCELDVWLRGCEN